MNTQTDQHCLMALENAKRNLELAIAKFEDGNKSGTRESLDTSMSMMLNFFKFQQETSSSKQTLNLTESKRSHTEIHHAIASLKNGWKTQSKIQSIEAVKAILKSILYL